VSLILEALKKLEREKQSPDRGGFLVLGPTSWPSAAREGRRVALVVAGLCGLVAGALYWQSRERGAAPPSTAGTRSPASGAPAAPTTSPGASTSRPQVLETMPDSVRVDEPAIVPERATAGRRPASEASGPTPAPAASVAPRFQLQAVSRRDGRAVAVLNDRLVYEGDSFDGATVIRIGEAEIELEIAGRRVVLGF
jgi:hypothetical protein